MSKFNHIEKVWGPMTKLLAGKVIPYRRYVQYFTEC